jgi:hypothetical protein
MHKASIKNNRCFKNIINDEDFLSHMKDNIKEIAKPNATRDFVNFCGRR